MPKRKNTRGTFDETFKRQTVRRAHRAKAAAPNGERLNAIALDVGINQNTLSQWMKKYPPGTPAEDTPEPAPEATNGHAAPSNGGKMSSIRIKGLDDFIRAELQGDTLRAIVREELEAMFGRKGAS